MVEIIKAGKKPEDKVITTTCKHCATKFRFKVSEARMSFDQRDGDALVIKCPLCSQSVWISP